MNYFRIKELMPLIRAEIGDARFDVLESQARAQAIPLFQAWVTTTDTPPVLIKHVLLENQKHMLPTL